MYQENWNSLIGPHKDPHKYLKVKKQLEISTDQDLF